MILSAEDRSKARIISSDGDQSLLAVYTEHLPALEPLCDGFFCVQEGLKLSKPGGSCAVNAVLQKP